ncbi:MAG: hypothetical protein COW00_07685 [Bdellovibrio sp. CG12_big_fil_rev_8_21_14_0_65_39_13]|nr:MAG: hypothetical protein COW78_12365 [Bdellovibrio sp. CG22_combo_CG10-13_8_21_14_all_39_27]PIQ60137.1 MAG: hypothetical protein COW00_07685 [Bdellovibrio sp. CG12_big_fil_rev_8_21_14_0_65_39_13]PIR36772.1 MAG: hypothetical protein COV37_01185 [Bdellovibrio sp. CG11_big_fil_rev_8_21_14_0_20_39_38]
MSFEIPYYSDYLSNQLKDHLLSKAKPLFGIEGLSLVGESGGLENKAAMQFLVDLYGEIQPSLALVLKKRMEDRVFIDERTRSCVEFNKTLKNDFQTSEYKTLLGERDSNGRIVIGPHTENYVTSVGKKPVAPIPDYLQGPHVTLFGPPDSEKMCVNAMNAFHRTVKNEPAIIKELVSKVKYTPKWGADNEDSKTPLHRDFQSAGVNLSRSLSHDLDFTDERGKRYQLENDHLSHAIKRFPGLALPSFFLFYRNEPVPLHVYDFALHMFENWNNKEALVFYVPKLENEEEAKYIKLMMETAESLMKKVHPEYQMGTIRLMIVLENPRAVFRVNEIMDELYPYFVGASLGWHDYLGSTARLFKEDPNYRIPVKADPDIVIKYIKASHRLLADVVGARGGIKVGGMYGILPTTYDIDTASFQVTMVGYIRDVITQMKRDLTGFWVAHPDFVRIGMALVEAWKIYQKGDFSKLESLVKSLLHEKHHKPVLDFILGDDIEGLDTHDPLYARSLLVADVGTSNIVANNDPWEIRYNVFQSLQYITDWLSGNGCVALPTNIGGEAVRIMDDLATAERSRWEVWHELYHGRFDLFEFLKIAHEELHFIRKDLSDSKKIVQVKWNEQNAKWYPVAMKIMLKLMTDKRPAEFATEVLLPFTIDTIRNSNDPWKAACGIDPVKFAIDPVILKFNYYFERCGDLSFAKALAKDNLVDLNKVEKLILSFNLSQIQSAASFHGDIGESKKTLDAMASKEQALVFNEEASILAELKTLGQQYLDQFGVKFLISAKGKSGGELLQALKQRIVGTKEQELQNARIALFEITKKRMLDEPLNELSNKILKLKEKFNVHSLQVAITEQGSTQQMSFGVDSYFEIASLSKTIGTTIALEIFRKEGIPLTSKVNELLNNYQSSFQIPDGKDVELTHLMNHTALNMHYVNGVPSNIDMPAIDQFLTGLERYGYEPVRALGNPGQQFHYSGAGFIVLEYLLELISKKKFCDLLKDFTQQFQLKGLISENEAKQFSIATGYRDSEEEVPSGRLMFPSIAAGLLGTATGMQEFLQLLTKAHSDINHPLHDTATQMLLGEDWGSRTFMGVDMGLGVFIGECGPNKVMIHQGANDGYRALFFHCFQGPNRGTGFTLLGNGELNNVFLNALVAQEILKELKFDGIDFSQFNLRFDPSSLKQEEIVNYGYKKLVFDAFQPDLPEVYQHEELDPLCGYNHLVGADIIEVSNQKFARAENVISPYVPLFDPTYFGRQGKVMDSWETVRHNTKGVERLLLKMEFPVNVEYASICTKYHHGNQVQEVELRGQNVKGEWLDLLPKTSMEGHSFRKIKLNQIYRDIKFVLVLAYPDGGLTRLGLYEMIPSEFQNEFDGKLHQYKEKIPATLKPLSLHIDITPDFIKRQFSKLKIGDLYDAASMAFGGKIVKSSNEHYGPAAQVISPFAPINMFDGLESARSRIAGNHEEVDIALAKTTSIESIECDFTYFVNNNPMDMEILGLSKGQWINLMKKRKVKAYAGNKMRICINSQELFEQIKVKCFPDGGLNRIHVFAKHS